MEVDTFLIALFKVFHLLLTNPLHSKHKADLEAALLDPKIYQYKIAVKLTKIFHTLLYNICSYSNQESAV